MGNSQALGSTRYPQTLLFRVLRPEPHGLSALVTGFLQDTLPTISNGTETLFCCVTWQPTDAAAVYSCAPPAPGKCPRLLPQQLVRNPFGAQRMPRLRPSDPARLATSHTT